MSDHIDFAPLQPTAIPAGRPWPLGVEWVEAENAITFALYSRHATGVKLLCYGEQNPARPIFEFRFQHEPGKEAKLKSATYPVRACSAVALRKETA